MRRAVQRLRRSLVAMRERTPLPAARPAPGASADRHHRMRNAAIDLAAARAA